MTGSALKIIALICMLIDHIGSVFSEYVPIWFRYVGRFSFPVFAFMIAQGCKYTKNMPKYLFRLLIFALISELPYDMAFNNQWVNFLSVDFFSHTNTFFTLFLGAFGIYLVEKVNKVSNSLSFSMLFALIPIYTALFIESDYGYLGVILIVFLYLVNDLKLQIAVLVLWNVIKNIRVVMGYICKITGITDNFLCSVFGHEAGYYLNTTTTFNLCIFISTMVPVLCLALYNGKKGKGYKWLFYVFYPLHLVVLAGIRYYNFYN